MFSSAYKPLLPHKRFLITGFLFAVLAAGTGTEAVAQTADQQAAPEPSSTKSQGDGSGGISRAFWNNPYPSIYGQVEALFIKQESRPSGQSIIVDAFTHAPFMSEPDFGFDPGWRAMVGKRLCNGWALEFSYFGLSERAAPAATANPGAGAFLIFPGNFAGNVFVGMDGAQANYSSRLYSFELNLLGNCGSGDPGGNENGSRGDRCRSVEWFGGLRYLNLGEELDISAQKTVAGALEEGNYNIRTANHLLGAQVGARLRSTWSRFGWEATGKAGLLGRDAQQTQSVTDFPAFPLRPTVSRSGTVVAYLGEINVSALYRLTKVWTLRAGYNVLWLDGLALAPDQLDFNFATTPSGNHLHAGGGLLLHGVNAGLDARW